MVGQSDGGFVPGDFSGYSDKYPYVRFHAPFRHVERGANKPPTLIGSAARALAKALPFDSEVSQHNIGTFRMLRRATPFRNFSLGRSMILLVTTSCFPSVQVAVQSYSQSKRRQFS